MQRQGGMKIYNNSGNSELFRVTGSQDLWREDGARKEDRGMIVVWIEFVHHVQ